MDAKAVLAVFGTVFLAELGDKTQHVNTRHLSLVAGAGFIVIGLWILWSALRG